MGTIITNIAPPIHTSHQANPRFQNIIVRLRPARRLYNLVAGRTGKLFSGSKVLRVLVGCVGVPC